MDTLKAIPRRSTGVVATLNGRRHLPALILFTIAVLVHYVEHLATGFEIWGLGWKTADSGGVIGLVFPWLVTSEVMHYSFAVFMLIGFFLLRPAFMGRALRWWSLALVFEFWHHFEQLLLIIQHFSHHYLFGGTVPTSTLQIFFPRVELHLFYNTIVLVPMLIALVQHFRPNASERARAICTCAAPAAAPSGLVASVPAADADPTTGDAPAGAAARATETGATAD
jgi:hypothetical protein